MTKLPVLNIALPRNVTAVHQIEITSRCNLRCVYCPSPQIVRGDHRDRPAMDMSKDDFEAALVWVSFFVKQRTQRELNLAGIGESTMHPDFVQFVRLARTAVGEHVRLVLATNGLIVTPEIVRVFVDCNVRVWVSLHRPEKAGHAVEAYRDAGVLEGVSTDPSVNAYDWAGQVKWFNSVRSSPLPCQWIREGKIFVRSDGYFAACCVDATGAGRLPLGDVFWHVSDLPGCDVRTAPYSLCDTCTQEIAVAGYNQRSIR